MCGNGECREGERELGLQSAFFSFGLCHLCMTTFIYDVCATQKVHSQRSANAIWEWKMPTRNAKTINHLIIIWPFDFLCANSFCKMRCINNIHSRMQKPSKKNSHRHSAAHKMTHHKYLLLSARRNLCCNRINIEIHTYIYLTIDFYCHPFISISHWSSSAHTHAQPSVLIYVITL